MNQDWSGLLGSGLTWTPPREIVIERLSSKLEINQRGLLLAPPVTIEDGGGISTTRWSDGYLHAAVLFWDVLDYPVNRMIEIGNQDIDSLEKLGVVRRSQVTGRGRWNGPEILIGAHEAVYQRLESESPGRWTSYKMFGLTADVARGTDHSAICVRLLESLPIPPIDRPFEDVLEFKQRRLSEILALRSHLDELAEAIAAAANSEAAFVTRLDRAHGAIAALRAVTEERYGVLSGVRLESSFSLTDAIKQGAIAFAATSGVAGAPAGALAAGATVLLHGLSINLTQGVNRQADTPFRIVAEIDRELR
jgi:hypothetical protein